ncbi:hypothetical protein AGLY_015468 [Aphis glycines]|uniref:Uncharacterized protein n=1 Tax=Aphis glycines TaxID=307491 RepID=A0A6G0T0E7_APHGL|nr:hypothetical protein AGLY_015468 [Aphis glycines]
MIAMNVIKRKISMCVKIVADNDSRDDSDAQRFTLIHIQITMAKRITDFFGVSSKKNKNLLIQNLDDSVDCSSPTLSFSFTTTEIPLNVSNSTSINSEWYKGSKLDANWLTQTFDFLKKVKLGKRSGIQYVLCFNQISEAKKLSRNGQVPITDGVRCNGKKELLRIIDHLNTDAHNAACCAEQTQTLWMSQSN